MSSTTLETKFRPRPWLRGGHVQTLWRKFTPVPDIARRRQRIELKDGDFIDIDWFDDVADHAANNRTIVLILHGLCGCSSSPYIQSLQFRLGQAGFPSVALNFRGCSGEVNRLARAYHSGISDDVVEAFATVVSQTPGYDYAAVGFSLGANVLLKWLGEAGGRSEVSRAVAVSTPFSLDICSQAMQKGVSRFYGWYFLRRLVNETERKKAHFLDTSNREQLALLEGCGDLRALRSIREFDNQVTAPLHGFRDADDYYNQCSSLQFLTQIAVPTLLLQSFDDPLIPPEALPSSHHLSPSVSVDFTKAGGHVGFAAVSDPFWLEHRIIRFLDSGLVWRSE